MTQADQKLRALFAQDVPPARDVIFQEAVLQALEKRLLWQDISVLASACVSAMVLIWVMLPDLEPMMVGLGRMVTPGLTILVLGALFLSRGFWRSRPSGI